MKLGNVVTRFINARDLQRLEIWRKDFREGKLEIPHGYGGRPGAGDRVTTIVAEDRGGQLLASLTGTLGVVLDPLVKNPEARPEDNLIAAVKLETVLTTLAAQDGAVDAYIAVPLALPGFVRLLQSCGYQITCQNCVIMRKPLVPDHILPGPDLE